MWMVNRKQIVAILVVMAFLMAGCASFSKNAYRTLSTSAVTYDASMKTLADLYKQGVIGPEEKATAIEMGTVFWAAYHTAVDALIAYEKTAGTAGGEKAEAALIEFQGVLVSFLNYARPLLLKGVPNE